jgi:hypothetical protein
MSRYQLKLHDEIILKSWGYCNTYHHDFGGVASVSDVVCGCAAGLGDAFRSFYCFNEKGEKTVADGKETEAVYAYLWGGAAQNIEKVPEGNGFSLIMQKMSFYGFSPQDIPSKEDILQSHKPGEGIGEVVLCVDKSISPTVPPRLTAAAVRYAIDEKRKAVDQASPEYVMMSYALAALKAAQNYFAKDDTSPKVQRNALSLVFGTVFAAAMQKPLTPRDVGYVHCVAGTAGLRV